MDISPKMIALARRRSPDLRFIVASMLHLPTVDGAWSGAILLYSIIHLTALERRRAFAELCRTLQPAGWLLVAFHIDAPGFAAGDVNHLQTFLGHPVNIDGYFLAPEIVIADLTATGFSIHARVERQPIPDIEFPSRRCYLMAQSTARCLSAGS